MARTTWMQEVMKQKAAHPDWSLGESMKEAKKHYKKGTRKHRGGGVEIPGGDAKGGSAGDGVPGGAEGYGGRIESVPASVGGRRRKRGTRKTKKSRRTTRKR